MIVSWRIAGTLLYWFGGEGIHLFSSQKPFIHVSEAINIIYSLPGLFLLPSFESRYSFRKVSLICSRICRPERSEKDHLLLNLDKVVLWLDIKSLAFWRLMPCMGARIFAALLWSSSGMPWGVLQPDRTRWKSCVLSTFSHPHQNLEIITLRYIVQQLPGN